MVTKNEPLTFNQFVETYNIKGNATSYYEYYLRGYKSKHDLSLEIISYYIERQILLIKLVRLYMEDLSNITKEYPYANFSDVMKNQNKEITIEIESIKAELRRFNNNKELF